VAVPKRSHISTTRRPAVRQADLVEDDPQRVLAPHALAVELEGRDHHALLVDRAGVGGHRAGCLAADVGHVPEHRRPPHHATLVEDRHDDQPVVRVADRGAAGVRVGREQDVALLDGVVEPVEEVWHREPELADHHLSARVADQWELVVLLPDAGGERGAEQHLVHLVAGVAQAVLDEVEGDRVDRRPLDGAGRCLDDARHQFPSTGLMSKLPDGCTVAA
jgi:hypothetical protein